MKANNEKIILKSKKNGTLPVLKPSYKYYLWPPTPEGWLRPQSTPITCDSRYNVLEALGLNSMLNAQYMAIMMVIAPSSVSSLP